MRVRGGMDRSGSSTDSMQFRLRTSASAIVDMHLTWGQWVVGSNPAGPTRVPSRITPGFVRGLVNSGGRAVTLWGTPDSVIVPIPTGQVCAALYAS